MRHMPGGSCLPTTWRQARMRVRIVAGLLTALSSVVAVSKPCDPRAVGAFAMARERVEKLDEFKAWRASHSFPVAFSLTRNATIRVNGRCYWEVPVYADRPERFELWHIFYVSSRQKAILLMDPLSGEAVGMDAWRKREAAR